MLTTLTIDDDVYRLLETRIKEQQVSLKEAVNDALRESLTKNLKREPSKAFKTKTYSLGQPKISSLDNIGEVLAIVEGEDYK